VTTESSTYLSDLDARTVTRYPGTGPVATIAPRHATVTGCNRELPRSIWAHSRRTA